MLSDSWDPATETAVAEALAEHWIVSITPAAATVGGPVYPQFFWRCRCGTAGGVALPLPEVWAIAAAHQAREVMVALDQAGALKERSDVDGS